jgi:DNA repair protein RadA/Sms
VAKTRTIFVCQQCGAQHARWMGRCTECEAWDSLVEQVETKAAPTGRRGGVVAANKATPLPDVATGGFERLPVHSEEFSRVLGGGLVPGSLVLVGGDPGVGKCLTASARVIDPETGAWVSIAEWAHRLRPVLALDETTHQLIPQPVAAFHDQGVQSVVDVRTRLGRCLRCTPSHPVYTPDGWQAVGSLQPGARIASPRSLPFFGNKPMAEHEVKLIAYVLSDGSAQSAICVTTAIPEVAADLARVAACFDMTLRVYEKHNNTAKQYRFVTPLGERSIARQALASALKQTQARLGLRWSDWARKADVSPQMLYQWKTGDSVPSEQELRRLALAADVALETLAPAARSRAAMKHAVARFLTMHGLRFSTARDKAVPACIFGLPKEQLALFLKILFTCDGSVYVNTGGAPGISYSTISQCLAQDVQHLLLRFGFMSRVRTKRQRVNNALYTAYEIQLLGVNETKRFLDEIGIWGRDEAQAIITALPSPTGASTHFDTVPTGPRFWQELCHVTGGVSLRAISAEIGVTIRNRRQDRPLTRTVVSAVAETYPSSYLQMLVSEGIYWDEIESIEPAGEERVYDLTVSGSANFVANDLIVHNSTLLTECGAVFAQNVGPVLYVSAEESPQQLKMRAERLGLVPRELLALSETNLDAVLAQITEIRPRMVIVDSIQTVYLEDITSAAGSVSQVRECALRLLRMAKETGIPMFLVGHVTKEGAIAGPRVLEHIVDAVLYLEGDRFHQYRLLRGVKNRFGSTNEVGVFDMAQDGMREVTNPSQVFLAERSAGTPGSAVAVMLEGTRPLLIEVQALTSHTGNAQPRRTANGFDLNRLQMLIAVLAKRVGLPLFNQDIYVNIVGGLRVGEPAVDLAVAVAIASSYRGKRIDPDMVLIGEVGLSGELRSVSQLERRLAEAAKLGFRRSLYPSPSGEPNAIAGLELTAVRSLAEAVQLALVGPPERHDEPED